MGGNGAEGWIGSVVCYIHSINSKEGPWLSTYISMYNDVPELPPTYVCSDIVTKRDIAIVCISKAGGGKYVQRKLCLLVLGRYVCCYGDRYRYSGGGEGLVVWEIGSLMSEQCAVTI